jgi:hypothetical protein
MDKRRGHATRRKLRLKTKRERSLGKPSQVIEGKRKTRVEMMNQRL